MKRRPFCYRAPCRRQAMTRAWLCWHGDGDNPGRFETLAKVSHLLNFERWAFKMYGKLAKGPDWTQNKAEVMALLSAARAMPQLPLP